MDFMNRSVPNQQPVRSASSQESVDLRSSQPSKGQKSRAKDMLTWWSHLGTNALWFIVALLVAAVAWLIFSSRPTSQASLVDSGKLQAVFLNSGQVYFGNIVTLNHDYLVLDNVYYLQSNSTGTQQNSQTNQNVSLIKLGCELHKPYDQMVVDTSQVTFWENLQSDGEVAKAVTQFVQQNPNGQQCSNAPAPATSGNNLQSQSSGSNTPANTNTNTNTSTNTTKKP